MSTSLHFARHYNKSAAEVWKVLEQWDAPPGMAKITAVEPGDLPPKKGSLRVISISDDMIVREECLAHFAVPNVQYGLSYKFLVPAGPIKEYVNTWLVHANGQETSEVTMHVNFTPADSSIEGIEAGRKFLNTVVNGFLAAPE